jgi:repressor LexA
LKLTSQGQKLLRQHRIPKISSALAEDAGGLPLVGRVAAGRPIDAIEDKQQLSLTTHFGSTDEVFALEVAGDSMIDDGINSGDHVICRRSLTAHNGQLVIAIIDDDTATLKRFYKEPTRVRLEPANKNYAPIYSDNCRIEGVVVGLLRKF